jgi:hypothetical protein
MRCFAANRRAYREAGGLVATQSRVLCITSFHGHLHFSFGLAFVTFRSTETAMQPVRPTAAPQPIYTRSRDSDPTSSPIPARLVRNHCATSRQFALQPALKKQCPPKPFSRGAHGACLLGDTAYWCTLAPRVTGDCVWLCVRDGPRSTDKAAAVELGLSTVRHDAKQRMLRIVLRSLPVLRAISLMDKPLRGRSLIMNRFSTLSIGDPPLDS